MMKLRETAKGKKEKTEKTEKPYEENRGLFEKNRGEKMYGERIAKLDERMKADD